MKLLREHIVFRILWFVLALHILNFSVDTRDPQPDHVLEDLSYNDMESIIEILLEQILNLGDVIPEHDEGDNDNGKVKLKIGMDFIIQKFSMKLTNIDNYLLNRSFQFKKNYYLHFQPEQNSPPPEA